LPVIEDLFGNKSSRVPQRRGYALGRMFWFTRKKFIGSYCFLMSARR
jgi:hypothetical protein